MVKKQDNQKKVFNHMKGYDEYLASSDTNQEILFKSFRRKLDLIKPELSAYEKIKTKLSSTASIVGTSLFIAGFLIARLTIPVSTVNIKGIEDQSYLEHLPTNIIEITSEKRFEKIYAAAMKAGISFEFDAEGDVKQIYIKALPKNINHEFKNLLELSSNYEGPVTILKR